MKDDLSFQDMSMQVFQYQSQHCGLYRDFLHHLNVNPKKIKSICDIPFLPIGFFKNHQIVSGTCSPEQIFCSSGTTGMEKSRHYVADLSLYRESLLKCFTLFYGDIKKYCILALLPTYLERNDSSLIYMVNECMNLSGHQDNGFFLNNMDDLADSIRELEKKRQSTLLIGVSFALLELTERFTQKLKHTLIMETGGMKGRKKEITRPELHDRLKKNFGVRTIHSEYSMTELLSQAYSKQDGLFRCPPWIKILIRDLSDPFDYMENGKPGGINIIDLANIHSCCFIETQDIGSIHKNGEFEVLGRTDNSDLRGCSLLMF